MRYFKGKRYFSSDPNFDPEEYKFRKPELEAGQTVVKYYNKP